MADIKVNIGILEKTILAFLLSFFCNTYLDASENQNIDSLVCELYTIKNDTDRLNVLDYLSTNHPNVDSTIRYATMELDLAQKLNDPYKRANSLRCLGWAHCFDNEIDLAYEYTSRANELYSSLNDTLNNAHCCNMLGMILSIKGANGTANGFYNRSLELYKALGRESAVAELYRNMGHQCLEYKVYDRAYEYFGHALDIDKHINNNNGVAEDLYNLGYGQLLQCIDENGSLVQLQLAKGTLLESYSLLVKRNTTNCLRVCCALADVYLEQSKNSKNDIRKTALDSCKLYIDLGNEILADLGVSGYKPSYNLRKARYAMACGDYMTSIQMLQNLESETENSDLIALSKEELYHAFTEYYETTGNYRMAYSYSKKINELNRRKNNDGYLVNSTQTKIQTEFDEEIRLIELSEREKELIYKEKSEHFVLIIVISTMLIVFLSLLVIVIYRNSVRRRKINQLLNDQNKRLAHQHAEILEQNKLLNIKTEEIKSQRDEIEGQRNYLSSQNTLLTNANHQITDSILYAKRIQEAAIPSDELMKSIFGDCLVFWRPLNIVSGDFYWALQLGKYKLLAVADCTGHGVPGAFLSMLGISLLNEIVTAKNVETLSASDVLNNLRGKLKKALRQTGKKGEAEDGIDLAFCIFNAESAQMQFAGAFRPLIIIRNGELIEYKADKMPCGVYINESPEFTNNIVDLEKGDTLYMYSDGISDQFSGGADMRKFTIRRVKEMLVEIHDKPFEQQKLLIAKIIDDWRKPPSKLGKMSAQVDDVLLVGLRIE